MTFICNHEQLEPYPAQPDVHDLQCADCGQAFKRSDSLEWLANQETIAELLTALEAMLSVRDKRKHPLGGCFFCAESAARARAAIAKARGK